MGFHDVAKAALTTIAVLLNSGDLPGRQSTPYNGMDDGNRIDFFEHTFAWSSGIGTSTTQEQEEGRSQEQGGQQTAQAISCGRGHRLGRRGVRLGTDRMKNRTWMIGHLRAQQRLYSNEIEEYKALTTFAEIKRSGCKVALMELFAGSARLTYSARH